MRFLSLVRETGRTKAFHFERHPFVLNGAYTSAPDYACSELNWRVACTLWGWRCEGKGLYGFAIATLKVLGVLALAGSIARGFVAFGRWRTSLRNRLIGIEPPRREVTSTSCENSKGVAASSMKCSLARRRRTRGSGNVISTSKAKWRLARDAHNLKRLAGIGIVQVTEHSI